MPQDQNEMTFRIKEDAYTGDSRIINSEFLNGMTIEDAKEKVILCYLKKTWVKKVTTDLKTGVFQTEYWGCPIPVVHCKKCGVVQKKRKPPCKTPRKCFF